jgi:5-methylcytosine-specific restriction endonuclease McrA
MIKSRMMVESLSSSELLVSTKNLVDSCAGLEVELLLHLGEIDHRKLYLDCGYSSLFVFCVRTYGFSEDIACSRIAVARAARRLPAILDSVRSGQVHLTGLRLLAPHLTPENHRDVLARAAEKSKREIEELVACLSPQPPVSTMVRKVPERSAAAAQPQPPLALTSAPSAASTAPVPAPSSTTARPQHRPVIAPLSEATFKIQFTASRAFRDKLRQAQDLLRHRVRDGDPAAILEGALDLLIEQVKKERFATGRKPRQATAVETDGPPSRHIPNAIQREVFERDGARCTFVGLTGHRCEERAAVEFDHVDGFARNPVHQADRIRLLCRAHNQRTAERMYGRTLMERKRASNRPIRPGTDPQQQLFCDPAQAGPVVPAGP